MKTVIFVIILCLGLGLQSVQAQQEQIVMDLTWDSPAAVAAPDAQLVLHPSEGPPVLIINGGGLAPYQATLFRIVAPKITTMHYAVIGEVGYRDAVSDSYLEMWSYFEPVTPGGTEGAYFSRTLAYSGPMGQLEGESKLRPFVLPFDATGAKTKLTRLEINLHLAAKTPEQMHSGIATILLRNLKLVQYPDGSLPVAQASRVPGMTWAWLLSGTVSACLLLMLAGTGIIIFFLIRRSKRIRHERELRRIASLDS